MMGKFDRRDKMPGHGSFENRSNVSSTAKTNFKPKKHSRGTPYFSDPLIIPRINQYLADNKDKVYVDINDMVSELQCRYKDYGRRKRNAFKQLVEKAFAVVLQQCGMSQGNLGQGSGGSGYIESTENSSSEVEECNISDGDDDKSVTSSNNQLVNLYKPSQLQAMTKQFQRCPNENAELIDLSSDDDNGKKKESIEDKGEAETKANGVQNHMFSRETTVTLVHGNSSKLGSRFSAKSSDRPQVTITRKHKLGSQTERNLPYFTKKRKDVASQEASVTFASFGGNEKVLQEVCKLILHIRHPELYRQVGVSSPRGFLLHGPPGCGKTLLATAIAGELDVTLIKVSAPELIGGVSGESEERIRDLFDRAIQSAPCVLFIDEVDAVTPNRQNAQREMERRIVAQLLTCLDELNNKTNGDQVLVIGATNRPDSLDPALRRAGRFDREVCLGIPDIKAREQILRVLCAPLKLPENFSFEDLAQNTPGFVGADLLALTREAAMAAINRVFGALQHQKKDKNKLKSKKSRSCRIPKGSGESKFKKLENVTEENMDVDVVESEFHEKSETVEKDSEPKSDSDKANTEEKCDEQSIEKEQCKNSDDIDEKTTQEVDDKEKEVKIDEIVDDKQQEKELKENKSKEKDHSPSKDDSDMDIAETVSEESVNCEAKDIEVSKDGSTKTADSDVESEVEVIPEVYDSAPPTLETLLTWLHDTPPLTFKQLKNVCITVDDFNKALKSVQPSAKREGFATVPDVTWDDIGSLADIREELKMSILGPVKYRKQFEQLGLTTPAGILICGPPGCGKTLLAKAVANEAGINFISVKGPELLNMYVGESERAVRQCFQRARNSAPCVIFFDELDALCPRRSDSGENGASMRVVNQMLTEMDGVEDRREVYLMAATNRPDIIDPAVLRPGRLDKILFVGLPDAEDRVDILRALTKGGTRPVLSENVNLKEIGERDECNGYSGADLAALVKEAGIQALKDLVANSKLQSDDNVAVSLEHFERALKIIKPSVTIEDRQYYDLQRKKYVGNRYT